MFSNSLLRCIFVMSDRIFKLIRISDLSAEKQQGIVLKIGSASKAEVEFKVSPKQQHLSLFIAFDLGLIARFHFFLHPPWFRMVMDTPALTGLHVGDMLPYSPPC